VDKARWSVRQAHASFAGLSTDRGGLRASSLTRALAGQLKLFKIVPEDFVGAMRLNPSLHYRIAVKFISDGRVSGCRFRP